MTEIDTLRKESVHRLIHNVATKFDILMIGFHGTWWDKLYFLWHGRTELMKLVGNQKEIKASQLKIQRIP